MSCCGVPVIPLLAHQYMVISRDLSGNRSIAILDDHVMYMEIGIISFFFQMVLLVQIH
jgi:hypothetical protein